MCLAVCALGMADRWPLVIATNRDEYHDRPSSPLERWPDGILAGRDLRAGGTWLGVEPAAGRWALLTNFRDGRMPRRSDRSRGELVPRVLRMAEPLQELAGRSSLADLDGYDPCNILGGTARAAWFVSNRGPRAQSLGRGLHGLSNGELDAPWPKTVNLKRGVESWFAAGAQAPESLFEALGNREQAADALLPSTGVALEWERMLSSVFIVSPRYGTRCSTVLAVDRRGNARMIERTYAPDGDCTGERNFEFVFSGG